MCRFIKLTKFIINTRHIVYIKKKDDLFHLHLHNHHMNGLMMFGSGGFDSKDYVVTICKDDKTKDYAIMNSWIDKLDKN